MRIFRQTENQRMGQAFLNWTRDNEDRSWCPPVVKSARKKSIALKTTPNGIELHVPKHLSERALQRLLQERRAWIERQGQKLSQQKVPTPFGFADGEPVTFLGDAYPLRMAISEPCLPLRCRLDQKVLWMESVADKRRLKVPDEARWRQRQRQALQHWFVQRGEHYFQARLPQWAERIGVDYHSVTVKTYKARWGSCYPDGRIQFNWKLMQAPEWVIDYVVVHELCHRIHPNHSASFWKTVEHHYPHTADAKAWLKTHGPELIAFLS